MIRRFVIARHGNSFADGETPRRIGARTDLPLVASGIAQAERLGDFLAGHGWKFDRILCSPLRRTRETAEAIRKALPDAPACETSSLLAEIDHGVDEDQPDDVVTSRIGAAALRDWERRGIPPPGWSVDAAGRMAGWRALFTDDRAVCTLLVTSNGAARFALLADAALAEQAATLPSLKLRTGAYGIIHATATGLDLAGWDQRP